MNLRIYARLLFFNSYVLRLFDYADIVWGDRGNATLMLQLQSLHNKAAKIIFDLPSGSSASVGLNKPKWKTLARRRAEHRATFIYKYLNNLFSHNSIKINMIIILDVKTISVRVHLVGIGGIGP